MVVICNKPFESNEKYESYFNTFPNINLSEFQKWAIKSIVDEQHILITAHTGSGKTLPAEFAIQHFVSKGKKVIYTAPIKALSNTKLSDLRSKYPSISFGIITGDITDNPEADVLIMTTEILPNTLVNRKLRTQNSNVPLSFEIDIETELAAVVFDEVHYINDPERGSVWEQAIIMLPPQVQLIMLSATIDKPHNLAKWIENVKSSQSIDLKQTPKKVFLAPTNHRVVPLTHYLWFTCHKSTLKSAKGTKYETKIKEFSNTEIVVKDEKGIFNDTNYHSVADISKYISKTHNSRISRQHVLNGLVRHLKANSGLPALCFVFSRKQTEIAAKEINFSLFDDDSTIPNTIEDECKKILISKLPNYKEYISLPEYHELVGLLKKGIGIHHAGVLSVFREMIEMLFEQRKLKLLLATETLAVGINFSTTSVIYTGIAKYDGKTRRLLEPHEYTQISGRAGRRGIDKVGKVWLCANLFDLDSITDFKHMLTGKPQSLVSKFRFSFNLGLNLIATNNANKTKNDNCISGFANHSFMMNDIDAEIRFYDNKIEELTTIISIKNNKLSSSFIEQNIIQEYKDKKNLFEISSKKQRKKFLNEIHEMEESHPNLQKQISIMESLECDETELKKLITVKQNTENYINIQSERTLNLLQKAGFVDTDINGMRKLNEMGVVAGQFQEIHPLGMSLLMIECNYFNQLEAKELAGLFACFANIVVSDDIKVHVPNTTSETLNNVTSRLDQILNEFHDMELLFNINSGSSYDRCFDIQQPVIEWCQATNEEECRILLEKIKYEKNIFLGEFIKALLKINNVTSEIERAAELTQQIGLLEKLKQIPKITLKYVASTQSLYI